MQDGFIQVSKCDLPLKLNGGGELFKDFFQPSLCLGLLLFFGSLNLFGLGLVGSYAWRGYENTKARPVAIPMLAERFGGKHDT